MLLYFPCFTCVWVGLSGSILLPQILCFTEDIPPATSWYYQSSLNIYFQNKKLIKLTGVKEMKTKRLCNDIWTSNTFTTEINALGWQMFTFEVKITCHFQNSDSHFQMLDFSCSVLLVLLTSSTLFFLVDWPIISILIFILSKSSGFVTSS